MRSACHNSPVTRYQNGTYCPVCFADQGHMKNRIWILYLVLSIAAVLMAVSTLKAPSITKTIATYRLHIPVSTDIKPSDQTVLEELMKNDCVLPSVAVAQARIETGNYTSDIAVNNKNLFGIKVHKCKYVTGKRKGHATFASYRDNIACYCHIQHRYLKKIDGFYAEDPHYCKKVKAMR